MRFLRLELLMLTMGLGLLGLFVRHGQPLDAIIGVALFGLALGNLEWREVAHRVRARWIERLTLRRVLPRRSGLVETILSR